MAFWRNGSYRRGRKCISVFASFTLLSEKKGFSKTWSGSLNAEISACRNEDFCFPNSLKCNIFLSLFCEKVSSAPTSRFDCGEHRMAGFMQLSYFHYAYASPRLTRPARGCVRLLKFIKAIIMKIISDMYGCNANYL